jgi:hypothetical protein
MNMDKASGFITTDWMAPDKTFLDYGTLPFSTAQRETRGKFNVLVKKAGESSSEMKVNCLFEVTVFYTVTGPTKYPCVSTGKLEAEVYKRVSEKAK